ncbi:response regulator [Jannaschia sp. S6380]|uniref:response regulator n=1 Tax=Jannaschia sp. S6380 TaxID=2926408 RepID=UPI001FF5B299|nr:response regulator [Jannaschia sp. S6380]MCK0166606.1 response regulator [Jannaschia sp. S6380]
MPMRDALRILIADDMSTSRGLLLQALDTLGLPEVVQATDGLQALELALSEKPDLVLSDLHMPGLDGLELLQGLRTDARTRATPFALITARVDTATLQAAEALGMRAVLSKPYTPAQLRDCIEAAIGPLG